MPQKLSTINAEELLSFPLPPIRFIIDGLLPQGLHILAGCAEDRQVLAGADTMPVRGQR